MKERYSEAALCGVAPIGVLLYIHFAQKLSAKHRGQKSYGEKSSGAKVLGGKCRVGANARGGGQSLSGKCPAGNRPRTYVYV